MRGFFKLTLVQIKLFLREPISAFFTVAFPLLLLFVFAGVFGNEPQEAFGNRGMVDVSVPGYLAMIIGTIALMSLPVGITTYRDKGILKRFRATPLQPAVVLGSQVVEGLVMLILGGSLLVLAARVFFDLNLPVTFFNLILGLLFASISFFTLGFMISGLVASSRAATSIGMAIFFPMLFLSGAALPRAFFPETVKKISDLLPLTHTINLIQDLWFKNEWNTTALMVLGGMFVVCLVVSIYTFRWE